MSGAIRRYVAIAAAALTAVAAAILISSQPARSDSVCTKAYEGNRALLNDLIDYWSADPDQKRAAWDSVEKSYSALQNETAEVDYMSCDLQTANVGIAANDTYNVFALANGTEPQTALNLNSALVFLLTTNVVDKVPRFTNELYDYLVRRLVSMYRVNHFSFPSDLTADECNTITSVVPDANCYDN